MKFSKTIAMIGAGYILNDLIYSYKQKTHPNLNEIKKFLTQAFIDKTGMLIYGEYPRNIGRVPSINSSYVNRVSYTNKYTNKIEKTVPTSTTFWNSADISFHSKVKAEDFMNSVEKLFNDQSGYITCLQFYSLAGKSGTAMQNDYGWLSLNGMRSFYKDGKFYIDMTYPVPLNI